MKNSTINLINESIGNLKREGIAQLVTEDPKYDGRIITLKGKTKINFGLCSYLGLEIDQRLKDSAIDAIQRYGIHYSCSRAYVSNTLFTELEDLISQIFNAPIVLSTSLSLGHHSVMPVVVDDEDAIIMDQQVHSSVQDAVMKLKARNVTVTIIRHNDLNELRKKTKELSVTHKKVWYMIDGVYSMYGDFAPIRSIIELMDENKKLHLYADDAHGMGWIGEKGKGYILSQTYLHPKMILATSLNKAFGAGGGVFIFSDKILCEKVRNCGTSFIFSAPHSMPVLGAAIASAKIFLSEEVYELQMRLAEKVKFCQKMLEKFNLPVISNPETPIFFIGVGLVRVGYNLVHRLIDDGFYINICTFPAVPETCTGLRFTITLHHTLEDIKMLVNAIAYHFPKALAEEERTINDVHRAFRRITSFKEDYAKNEVIQNTSNFKLSHSKTIKNVPKQLWDSLMKGKGSFDWNTLLVFEEAFNNNPKTEDNWEFHYYIIKDNNNNPVLATFFTITVAKDDMLSPKSVSQSVEQIREKDQYFLTSRNMMMGTLVSEGNHLFVDRKCKEWKKVLMMLIDAAWKEQDRSNASLILMRDFDQNDFEICNFFKEQGFIMFELPDAHLMGELKWKTSEEYLDSLKHTQRYYLKNRVFEYEDVFEIKINSLPTEEEVDNLYQLYLNISKRNLEINVFIHPKKLFSKMAKSGLFEFISIYVKPEFEKREKPLPVGMAINYLSGNLYCFMLTGLDYDVSEKFNVYPQILWQVVKRARELNIPNITLGYTASQNKRKFGAKTEARTAFIQMKDNFNMNLIEIMSKTTVSVK